MRFWTRRFSVLVVMVVVATGAVGCGASFAELGEERDLPAARHEREMARPETLRGPIVPTVAAPAGEFVAAECPYLAPGYWDMELDGEITDELLESVRCGYLIVPQNRDEPDGPTIELAVAIVASRSLAPFAHPVLYLEGGPGGGAVYDAAWWLDSPLRNERELILIDQRGTGFSRPNLACPELTAYDDEAGEDFLLALARCRDRLEAAGVDLAAYDSVANAHDLADLRAALGIEQWNLLGVSYGTRLALTLAREHPAGIRSMVLDSVYPPDVDSYGEQVVNAAGAIEALLDGCVADRACRRAFPDLRETFFALLAELDTDPLYFEPDDLEYEFWGDESALAIDAYTFVNLMVDMLYDTDMIRFMPWFIDDVAQGNTDWLLEEYWYYSGGEGGDSEFRRRGKDVPNRAAILDADGMFYSVECVEEGYFIDAERAKQVALARGLNPFLVEILLADVEQMAEACAVWLGDRFFTTKPPTQESAIPTLILAGEYDPVTPPAWALHTARWLPNHLYVEMARGGHGLTFFDDCFVDLILQFLDSPIERFDSSCAMWLVQPFETP